MVLTYLICLMPAIVLAVTFVFAYLMNWGINDSTYTDFFHISAFGLVILAIWMWVWVYFQKQILFTFTHTRELQREENPEVYNIVENLCISQWLPKPKVWIIDSAWLNAYATGWNPNDSRVVFTKGLIETLNKEELEAVAGHEISHIQNWDVKNMIIVNVFIGAISTIGYYMMKMRSRNSKSQNPLPLLWVLLYAVWIAVLPLIHLAISRKKEYIADAGSANLLKDTTALASALRKISANPRISALDSKGSTVASMFIDNPKKAPRYFKKLRAVFSTHPSIEDRIASLQNY